MALSEFDLIDRFFCHQKVAKSGTRIGIGDDGAILSLSSASDLVVSTDTLLEGVHFLPGTPPEALGHKALAVNLSDIAAMGALPQWVFLSLTLPTADETWLEGFSKGFLGLAKHYSVELVGGDTTRGPLSVTVTILGQVTKGEGLCRHGAKCGDSIFVTGLIGDAGLGLHEAKMKESANQSVLERYMKPVPRVQAGSCLESVASSCIDISDGLAADLGHILEKSGVGASLEWEKIPLSKAVSDFVIQTEQWDFPLIAGDDYELCFTVPASNLARFNKVSNDFGCLVTCIGSIEEKKGLRLSRVGKNMELEGSGYRHF